MRGAGGFPYQNNFEAFVRLGGEEEEEKGRNECKPVIIMFE